MFRFRIYWIWRHEHKVPDASISTVLLPLVPNPASAKHKLIFNCTTYKINYNNFILCSTHAVGTSRQFTIVRYYWLNCNMYTNRLTKIYCDISGITANCELIIPVSAGDTYPWRHFTWPFWTPAYKINRPNGPPIFLPNLCTYLIKNYHNSHLKPHTLKMSVMHN